MEKTTQTQRDKERKNQGGTYCRPEMKNRARLQKTSKAYCDECGFKLRGENHFEGPHHKQKHPTKR